MTGMLPALPGGMNTDQSLRDLEFELQDIIIEIAISCCLTRCERMLQRIRMRELLLHGSSRSSKSEHVGRPLERCCACGKPMGAARRVSLDRHHAWHPGCDDMVCNSPNEIHAEEPDL